MRRRRSFEKAGGGGGGCSNSFRSCQCTPGKRWEISLRVALGDGAGRSEGGDISSEGGKYDSELWHEWLEM